jgi:hypothetical protein
MPASEIHIYCSGALIAQKIVDCDILHTHTDTDIDTDTCHRHRHRYRHIPFAVCQQMTSMSTVATPWSCKS